MAPKADVYLMDDKTEVYILERSHGVTHVESVENGSRWHTLSNRLVLKTSNMNKPLFINPDLLNTIPNGKYAVFIDDYLHEVIMVENYDSLGKIFTNEMSVVASMTCKQPLKAEEYIATLGDSENVKIVLTNKVKI